MKARSLLVASLLAGLLAAPFAGCSVNFDPGALTSSSTVGDSSFSIAVTSGGSTAFASSGPGGLSGFLGAPCATDSDCGGVLKCLSAATNDPIFGGGPAGGFCTKACDKGDDCPGANSTCLKNSNVESGRCALTCSIGPALMGYDQALDPAKCRGREDLRCEDVKGTGPVCLPTCGSDAQCGPGRACDPRLAVCVTAPSAGLPTGSACDPNASPTTCAGRCVSFEIAVNSCSSPCVLGGASLDSLDCGGPTQGLCAFAPSENGPGDVGYCTPSCSAQSDCQNPAFWCFTVPNLTAATGKGYCFATTPCKSQVDCDQPDQKNPYTCTATAYGSFCLDSTFPLQGAGSSSSSSASASTSSSTSGSSASGSSSSSGSSGSSGSSSASGAGGAGSGGAGGAGGAKMP